LKFYQNYNDQFKLIILDSSPNNSVNEELNELLCKNNISWNRYRQDIRIVDKIADGLNCVETEYSVICAEDDFLINNSLYKCTEFLDNNPDYICAQGLFYTHTNGSKAKNDGFTIQSIYPNACSLTNDTGKERFLSSYINESSGTLPFYSVYRTDIHQRIWRESVKYVDGVGGYIELFPCALSDILGTMKVLPIFYSSREPNNAENFHIANIDIYREMHSQDKTLKVLMGLSKQLSKVDGISLAEAEKVINQFNPRPECFRPGYVEELGDKPIKNYPAYASYMISKISSIIRKQKHLMSLLRKIKRSIKTRKGCPRELYPYYYKDFMNVKNAVVSAGLTYEQLNIGRTAVPAKYVSESITKE